jgi:predicted GIY-YIG superfamily endonuclease
MSKSIKHHNVYVIQLNVEVLRERNFIEANPNINLLLPCFYVGMTGLSPEERFQNHQEGHRSSRFVSRYGLMLVPELFEKYNPMTYEDAVKMEKQLAEELRKKGHGVWQN